MFFKVELDMPYGLCNNEHCLGFEESDNNWMIFFIYLKNVYVTV